jgi:4-hydroxybenzoate polyprenyltransferase
MLFFPGWSTMFAGYFISTNNSWYISDIQTFTDDLKTKFILLFSFAMLMGSTFILNQLKDVISDRENKKLFIISDGYLTRKSAYFEVGILLTGDMLCGFLLKIEVGLLYIIFFLITGIFYNYKPFIMKNRPWGSLFANISMGWLAFAIGYCAVHNLDKNLFISSLPYVLFNSALYLFTILPDVDGDKRTNKKTLAVILGTQKVIILAFIIYCLGLIYSLFLFDRQALFFYALSLPFFLKTIITRYVSDTIKATKLGILFFALTICLRWPIYFFLMYVGFFLTKLYFRKRFNLDYPNFSGA